MKKLIILGIVLVVTFNACNENDFADSYANPSKISTSTVEKMYSGFMYTNRDYVLKAYWNYFVVLRTTLTHYTQAVGWINGTSQYIPGEAGIGARWGNYYSFLAHYREMEKIYDGLTEEEQDDLRIFMITATIYLYDHTQKVVDLHGAMPFTEAGRLSQNGGDYLNSLPSYDSAESVYTTMLDGLKGYADELNSMNISDNALKSLEVQDFVNNGDIELWKKYCNSLRLRMLTRVSASSEFQSRAQAEISSILDNPGSYPVVENNSENIMIDVHNLDSPIHSKGFQGGLEDWDGNIAGKVMMDHMLDNADPRLRAMFEPGEEAAGAYLGLDPLMNQGDQEELFNTGTVSIYNRSTLSRNQYFPGTLITASEVSLLKAEAYVNSNNDGMAKSSYETAINQSVSFYYWVRTLSNDEISGPLTPFTVAEVLSYTGSDDVNFDNAASNDEKMDLIATEKWIHFSVVQMPESWAEVRRLNLDLSFVPDNSSAQTLPPDRWIYPSNERTNNTENYSAVSADDNLTTKIFWDVN